MLLLILSLSFISLRNTDSNKNILLIVDKNTCDLPGSICFENIYEYSETHCVETNALENSSYFDSINILLENNELIEDTSNKKQYGCGLIAYLKLTSEKKEPNIFGITKSSIIFNNNKTYFANAKFNLYLSRLSETYKKAHYSTF